MKRGNFILNHNVVFVITEALRIAVEDYRAHAATFRDVADKLRAGGEVPMFAKGTKGVDAAKRLIEQFEANARDAQNVRSAVETAAGVYLGADEGNLAWDELRELIEQCP